MEVSPASGNFSAFYDPVAISERITTHNQEVAKALYQQNKDFLRELSQLLFLISGGKSSSSDKRGSLLDVSQ